MIAMPSGIRIHQHQSKRACFSTNQKRGSSFRSGAVVVEFSFIAVFLVFITLGMVETHRGLMVKEALNNAARSVCRVAIKGEDSSEKIHQKVKQILKEHNLPEPEAHVSILVNGKETEVSAAQRFDKITVVVTLPVYKVYWVSTLFVPGETKLTESVTMMRQG